MHSRPKEVEPWIEYVQRHARGAKQEQIAAKIGVTSSTVGRWKDKEVQPRAEHVVEFARQFGRAPVEALIHAGYVKPEEVGAAVELAASMREVSDDDLVKELADRLAELRGLQLGGHDPKDGLPPHWGRQDPSVSRVENGDQGS
jgi:transcriptional regulator with XRE-family HTH domain